MKSIILVIAFILFTCFASFSQADVQYFITLNGSYYLPIASDKQVYPILGYDKDADPKVLLGGFGVGFAAVKKIKEKLLIKGQLNFSKHAYWDNPIEFRDAVNNPLGSYIGKSVDYVIGSSATLQYHLSKWFAIGPGFGADILLSSFYILPKDVFQTEQVSIKYYKTFTPVLPIESSFYLNKVLINIRYEQGLVNKLREPVSDYEKDKNSLLVFEIGYRIN